MNFTRIEIDFEKVAFNAIRFIVVDLDSGKVLWKDVVRVSDSLSTSCPPAREALSPYSFWMDLKKLVGDSKPLLLCNDVYLLKCFYREWKEIIAHRNDPWLFVEE